MYKFLLSFLALALSGTPALADNVAFEHGRWFDGRGFAAATFFSVNGTLTRDRPSTIDRTIDLGGKFVVPAFGDAHHHGIDGIDGLDAKIAATLDAGVFYVKNPNVIPDLLTPAVRDKLNGPRTIDVTFSNGGLTASGGHPVRLHDMLSKRGVFPGMGPADMHGRAYFLIDSAADLDAAWPRIVAGKPDFLKTFLLYSEEFDRRKALNTGAKGLDPKVLELIVARARQAGLRVSTHIETAADFRHAVLAGVDEINHLPHLGLARELDLAPYLIDDSTAQLAAQKKVKVVATLRSPAAPAMGMMVGPQGGPGDEAQRRARMKAKSDAELELNRRNLQTLARAGVSIALGSDGISGEQPYVTSRGAAEYLHVHGIFDVPTIIGIWSANTSATIFPERKLGRLEPGYEADFLVLEGNPVANFANLSRIAMRVKHGNVLP
ncbi:MAG TPA: amidohydrolase family protein [Telluria sp.]|nr:amidohydrolase family protein [Telluria sp.]